MSDDRLWFYRLPDIRIGRYKGGLRSGVWLWLRYRWSWRPERWDGSPGVRCASFGPFYANQAAKEAERAD